MNKRVSGANEEKQESDDILQKNTPTRVLEITGSLQNAAEDAKFLLVDDNKTNIRYMRHIFDKLGLKYQIAWNGQEAIDVYKANPERCRLILLDLAMPVMGGLQAAPLLRRYESENGLEPAIIVGLTGSTAEAEHRRLVDEFGMDTTLRKPFRTETLEQLLAKWPV
ncbi:hypothetical protein F66182_7235 [Fusarium sp. NRRL 66182]|nr:hypothetical protein F66182_7235 [Fusarium sp. NRRL 66182]